jgi:hypothetical protein
MFDWLARMQQAMTQRERDASHAEYVANHRRLQQSVHEALGFAESFKQYLSAKYQIDLEQALQDCGEHAEDWDDCVHRTFMEWKSGAFSDAEEAFDDLWAEIETMLDWEGKRHKYPQT